ncbi:uncharacterized protein TRAVEDRAFT_46596 [Trametes versicolor FP-101664 SS1]|uniref:uncharacterized protein n=1 Tax=Trametes versicolor (strain FP-101664) TaxID=717944 RepID=UPI0004623FAA|nr:uncharacterized protein TRAVEDRAFT_46596 [Trametes versicolor FP-101664 SS1]EIW59289.1 hypothetical protein TRAVEDRAFT_46596 [Trametes versicolor FP-101664 SS1]
MFADRRNLPRYLLYSFHHLVTRFHIASLDTMGVREIPPAMMLDIPATRSISPGGCISARDVDMASPTAWASLPGRPRTSESRRPSFSISNAPDIIPADAWRIQHGRYVAFQLDTAAVAENTVFAEGSKEWNEILNFPVKRYIGLVVGSQMQKSDDKSRWLEELHVLYVVDLEELPELPGTESWYMPIAPLKAGAAAGCGRAIQTKTIFPWAGLSQCTVFGARLQIQELHTSQFEFGLDEDELERFLRRFSFDGGIRDQLKNECDPFVRAEIEMLEATDQPLLATVWCDIRPTKGVDYSKDPREFVKELYDLVDVIHQSPEQPVVEQEETMMDDEQLTVQPAPDVAKNHSGSGSVYSIGCDNNGEPSADWASLVYG